MTTPWKNDWSCPQCYECNSGKDRKCVKCETPIPPDLWLNNHTQNERKYCRKCGKRKNIDVKSTNKKKPDEKDKET